ncbi:hypothetical protein ACIBQX_32890 [Nonomuraea sp. NPDC049714]|uniref:hypothetical protein n=1 Tax=Nonomuraea sp. NPDC049714 TaxID=3364357 RepID=UPI0037A150E9
MEIYTHALDDSPIQGAADMATLFGVTVGEYYAECQRQSGKLAHGSFTIPQQWMRNGRRLHREAAAVLGHDPTVHEVLAYLKAKQAEE